MINWYLEELSGEIETEEELLEQKQVVGKVVDKLIYQDQVCNIQCCYFQKWGVGTWHSVEKAPHFSPIFVEGRAFGGHFLENNSKWN